MSDKERKKNKRRCEMTSSQLGTKERKWRL